MGTEISSTLGSFLRNVTGTSAIRTSSEAAGRKFQEVLAEDVQGKGFAKSKTGI